MTTTSPSRVSCHSSDSRLHDSPVGMEISYGPPRINSSLRCRCLGEGVQTTSTVTGGSRLMRTRAPRFRVVPASERPWCASVLGGGVRRPSGLVRDGYSSLLGSTDRPEDLISLASCNFQPSSLVSEM